MEREHKILYAISFGAVLLVLVLMGICSLVLPKPTESVIERRRLAEKPDFTAEALLDGSYTEGMDLYYSDTFPGREKLVSLASFLKEHLGLRGEDDTRLHTPTTGGEGGGAQSQPQASSQPEQDLPEDAAASSSQPEDPGAINTVNALPPRRMPRSSTAIWRRWATRCRFTTWWCLPARNFTCRKNTAP